MVRINLLPARFSKKKEAGKQQLVLFAVLLVAGLVGNYLWTNSRAGELAAHEKRLAKTRGDIAQLDKIIGEVKSLRTQQQALQEKLGVLDQLKKGRTGPVRMLDELATVTPKRLWLTKLEEKGGSVTFEGTASTIDEVSTFMTALKASRFFEGIELKKTEAKAQNAYRVVEFKITATGKYAPKLDGTADGKGAAPATAGRKAGG